MKNKSDNESVLALNHITNQSPEFIKISEQTGILKLNAIKDRSIFISLVRAVISQQISGKASEKIYSNLVENIGNKNLLSPNNIIEANLNDLNKSGISKNKSICIREIALGVIHKQIPTFNKMSNMNNEEIIESLTKIKGIGTWTAEMILIFKLGRKDILPIKDLAVLRGFQNLYNYYERDSINILEKTSKKWKPYRSFATLYLYKAAGTKSIVA